MAEDGRDERFGTDSIEGRMRERIREVIEKLVEEELDEALGAGKSARIEGRRGYRHGCRERTLTTSLGPTSFPMPRARVRDAAGKRKEWHSQVIPRYQRRTSRVDEAILGLYLSGANTRRSAVRCRRCCEAGRCRRALCRAWWDGSPRTSGPGATATWLRRRSGT
jgi:transposase-like protein